MKHYDHKVMSVSELIPYANNSRTHSDQQIKQIASSIKEFGFTNPVLIDETNSIIAGHGRVLASELLNIDELPVIVVDGLREAQKKALVIADNQLALNAGWDEEILKNEITDLVDQDFDIELLGFDDAYLDDILKPDEVEGLTDDDDVPETPEVATTVTGDVWILGDHRLICGDATDVLAYEQLMDGKKGNFCFTSPPYNVGKNATLHGNTNLKDNKYGLYNDDVSDEEYFKLLTGFTNSALSFVDCIAVNIQQLAGNKTVFVDYMSEYKLQLIDVAIWDKGHTAPAMAPNVMNSRFEYVVFVSANDKASRAIPSAEFRGTVDNVYSGSPAKANKFSKVHSATFPVDFAEWAVTSFTTRNGIVVDCFGGTGTTMIACEKHHRSARLIELDPKYCDVIIKRWQDYTGKKAVHENGKLFEEIE